MYSLQYRPQMDHTLIQKMGGGRRPHFLHIYYGPSVACTVGCTWLTYSLCMAHIWPMYDLYMDHIYGHIPRIFYRAKLWLGQRKASPES